MKAFNMSATKSIPIPSIRGLSNFVPTAIGLFFQDRKHFKSVTDDKSTFGANLEQSHLHCTSCVEHRSRLAFRDDLDARRSQRRRSGDVNSGPALDAKLADVEDAPERPRARAWSESRSPLKHRGARVAGPSQL